MKRFRAGGIGCAVACLLAFPSVALAEAFSQAQLDQMLAPIALYPDALLGTVLMASTYPAEVAAANHRCWRAPGFESPALENGIGTQPWDESVEALCAFPAILDRMTEGPLWTERLGEAFTSQEQQVMDTIQSLRRKARAAGKLRSDFRQTVSVAGGYIDIEPANPRVIFVPTYVPTEAYGGWWWPAFPPHFPRYWSLRAKFVDGFSWGAGVKVPDGWIWAGQGWTRHVARVR